MIKNKFTWLEREELGRKYALQYFTSKGIKSKVMPLNTCYDLALEDGTPVEIKTRDTEYPDYLLERAKFDNIFKYSKADKFLYVNIIAQDDIKVIVYELHRGQKLNWQLKWCPFASCRGSVNAPVRKEIALLPVEQAIENNYFRNIEHKSK